MSQRSDHQFCAGCGARMAEETELVEGFDRRTGAPLAAKAVYWRCPNYDDEEDLRPHDVVLVEAPRK